MSVALSITFNMHNAVVRFMESKCVADKVKPAEKIGLTLTHTVFCGP